MLLRPLEPRDHAYVLELNARDVEFLSPLDEGGLLELLEKAYRADLIEVDAQPAGFVITFAPGAGYNSENYRWFSQQYGDRFHYLDRIVIGDDFRRRGVATAVYDQIERHAAPYGRLTLEVNTQPPNVGSLAFHSRRGYVQVGEIGDHKRVAMLTKALDV